MKLSQRMITNFCVSVSSSTTAQQYTTLAGSKDSRVRVTVRKATDPGQPNGLVLCAATSIWLPVSPQTAFDFFRDVRMRPQVSFLNSESFQQREKIPFFVNQLFFKLSSWYRTVGCSIKGPCCSRGCSYFLWLSSWKLHFNPKGMSKFYRHFDI